MQPGLQEARPRAELMSVVILAHSLPWNVVVQGQYPVDESAAGDPYCRRPALGPNRPTGRI